ncbi:MAG: hypothetical protein HOP16_06190 [Acidobacteria bacterium]|nr:hypothetical protein [Acidobacteriota bacterium]
MPRLIRVLPLVLLLSPVVASAQSTPAPQQLVVERIHTPFVIAPDYKVTELNGDRERLAGGYAGRLFDDKLFIGGAGYWLLNAGRGEELAYGGVLLGWSTPQLGGMRVGVRSLIGGGSGRLARDVTFLREVRDPRRPALAGGGTPTTARVLVRDDFFVFEPQVNVTVSPFEHVGVNLAGGYRLTGLTDALDGHLNGATGSVGLQFQW